MPFANQNSMPAKVYIDIWSRRNLLVYSSTKTRSDPDMCLWRGNLPLCSNKTAPIFAYRSLFLETRLWLLQPYFAFYSLFTSPFSSFLYSRNLKKKLLSNLLWMSRMCGFRGKKVAKIFKIIRSPTKGLLRDYKWDHSQTASIPGIISENAFYALSNKPTFSWELLPNTTLSYLVIHIN